MAYNIHEHLAFLKAIPVFEQRSNEWLTQRKSKLTSSDAATALGINPYKKSVELLLEKCGAGRTFSGNEYTLHGQKYEDEAAKVYENLMHRDNHMFGLISFGDLDPIRKTRESSKKYIDPKYHFLAGSPDGISIDRIITEDTILMQLEIKCPMRRKIKHSEIPDHYFPQVQLNMFIADLQATDFVEYIPSAIGNKEFNILRLQRDDEWFDENFPILEQFWKDVLFWRTQDITTHPDYHKYYDKPTPSSTSTYMFVHDSEADSRAEEIRNGNNGNGDNGGNGDDGSDDRGGRNDTDECLF